MAKIDITAQRVRELYDYNPDTGIFTTLPRPGTRAKTGSNPSGKMKAGYVRIAINRVMLLAHRVAWLHYYGEWPKQLIDHINGIKDDNRIANLRDVSDTINAQNIRKPRDGRSGILGVNINAYGKISASIKYEGKHRHLGFFSSVEEARDAYLREKRLHHEGCTV
jgi:hypothetical protein